MAPNHKIITCGINIPPAGQEKVVAPRAGAWIETHKLHGELKMKRKLTRAIKSRCLEIEIASLRDELKLVKE